MPKKDPIAEAIAKVAALRAVDDAASLSGDLGKLIGAKSTYVVARAADLAGERGVRGVLPALVERLGRLLDDRKSDDAGCSAALALVRALTTLEAGYEAEDVALRTMRLERWEAVWGGSVDTGVSVRGHAAILLAAMGSTQALRCATELLAEPDQRPPRERNSAPARADAARALTMIGSDGAAAVLRFKLLIGDADPNVLCDCLAGLLTIERDAALPLAEQLLRDSQHAEAAILAVGGWRDPRAFGLLRAHADAFLASPTSRDVFLASVAMTRQSDAIEYLLHLVRTAPPSVRTAAATALEPLRMLPGVEDRLKQAMKGSR